MADPKEFEPCIVTWEDAITNAGEQYENPQAVLDAYKPTLRKTLGYWIGRTERVVCVVTDDDRSAAEPKAIGGPSFIPAGIVRSVQAVQIAQSAKRGRRK